jgi:hypothetical protein
MRHAFRGAFVAIVAMSVLLAGCPVPLPPLGYDSTSRSNVPGERPDWIVDGRTSREDVLLRLGTPDVEARDGSWIGYLSSRHEGGVAFVVIVGGGGGGVAVSSYTERRLVVWLDANGIVSKTEFTQKECPHTAGFAIMAGAAETEPCLNFADIEGGATKLAGTAAPDAGTLVGSFDDVAWLSPFSDPSTGNNMPTNRQFAFRGPVIVTTTALVASGNQIGWGQSGHLRIEFGEVADIARSTSGRLVALVVTTTAGVEYQFTAVHPGILGMIDLESTDRLIKLIEDTLQRPARAR